MERYKIIKTVGDGAYGTVYKAVNRSNGEVVAIKKMKKKFYSWDECLALREVKSLRKLSHNNVVKLKEAIRVNDELHLVFEYLDQDIYQLIKDRTEPLPEKQIRSILFQIFQGLEYTHKHGFFHRDMKPENLMIHGDITKIADFGLAREIRSRPPFTDYVSTRWYRAPEILLRTTSYNYQVDIFAMGCIMAELYTLRPLAPGANETDQLLKFCNVLGTPTMNEWADGYRLASAINFRFPHAQPVPLHSIVKNSCNEALSLLGALLSWDPHKRPSATECLQHPYFSSQQTLPRNPEVAPQAPSRGGNPESRGLPSALRKSNSKWSQGSSRIGGNSSKGRWNLNPPESKASPMLPMLREPSHLPKPNPIPSQVAKYKQPAPYELKQEERRLPPLPSGNLIEPQRHYNPNQGGFYGQRNTYNTRIAYNENPPRYLAGMNELPKKLPSKPGMGGIGSSILGNRMGGRGMQKGSILPSLGRHRF